MVYIFLCVFIFFLGLSELRAAVEEGVPCETPDDVYGICLDIHKCPKLINLLITQSNDLRVRNFLRASTCGFIGNSPMVCCPQPRIDDNPSNTSKTPEPRTEPIDPDPVVTPSTITTKLPVTPNCGYSNVTNTRIVNGNPAKLGEFPWIVALGYKNSKNPKQPKWLCGGSLITDRHILTAGHCVHNRADLYLARVGALDLYSQNDNDKPEDIRLIKAKIHEGYSPVNFTNDIAILTLASTPKIASVWPVCLPINDPYRSRNFVDYYMTVAGWGSLYFNGPSSSVLQEVVLPVVDNQKCKVAFKGTASVIDERVLCAGYLRGGKDACQGDSGGPLILRNSEGNNTRSYQIGIVSYGFRCAQAGYPGVYTRISQFIEWIQKNLD